MKTTTQMMELARGRYLAGLPFPHSYRPGKYTGLGFPRDQRATLCEVEGAGVFKRLWTTHSEGTRMRIYLYLDGVDEPVLHGGGLAGGYDRVVGFVSGEFAEFASGSFSEISVGHDVECCERECLHRDSHAFHGGGKL